MTAKSRSFVEALANAERIRRELPHLIQPEQSSFDLVTLADEIYFLRRQIYKLEKAPK